MITISVHQHANWCEREKLTAIFVAAAVAYHEQLIRQMRINIGQRQVRELLRTRAGRKKQHGTQKEKTTIAVNNRHRHFRTLRKLHSGYETRPCQCYKQQQQQPKPKLSRRTFTKPLAATRLVNTKIQQQILLKKCL